MGESELKHLIARYLDGVATPEEEDRLLRHYEALQGTYTRWDDGAMGDEDRVRQQIYRRIKERAAPRVKRLGQWQAWKIAASIAVVCLLSVLIYTNRMKFFGMPGEPALVSQATGKGELLKIVLPDSSRIWLNAESDLQYPVAFDGNTREVFLDGEAYFEVAHNAERPFIIHTGEVSTKVLGTSFNIAAYETAGKVEVSVLTGKVQVRIGKPRSEEHDVVLLLPDQQVTYHKDDHSIVKKESGSTEDKIGWTRGKLVFRDTPLSQVVERLHHQFDAHISIGKSIEDCLIYADFEQTDSLHRILRLLSTSLNSGNVTLEGRQDYRLTGRGCE